MRQSTYYQGIKNQPEFMATPGHRSMGSSTPIIKKNISYNCARYSHEYSTAQRRCLNKWGKCECKCHEKK